MKITSVTGLTLKRFNRVQSSKFKLCGNAVWVMPLLLLLLLLHYSDWVCTAVMSNDVMKDLRG